MSELKNVLSKSFVAVDENEYTVYISLVNKIPQISLSEKVIPPNALMRILIRNGVGDDIFEEEYMMNDDSEKYVKALYRGVREFEEKLESFQVDKEIFESVSLENRKSSEGFINCVRKIIAQEIENYDKKKTNGLFEGLEKLIKSNKF